MLSREVELQLQELLDNRPNEDKTPIRYRNKRKDIIKNAKRGDGYDLVDSIINKRIEEELVKRPPLLDEHEVIIKFTNLDSIIHTEYNKRMFSQEELNKKYEGYHVTQNQTALDEDVKLNATKYRWAINLADKVINFPCIQTNTVVIEGKEPNMDYLDGVTFRLDSIQEVLSRHLVDSDIEQVQNMIRHEAYAKLLDEKRKNLRENPSEIVTAGELKTIQITLKYQHQSNWIKKKYVERKKSTLRNYLYNQLKTDGDYGLLHNTVDLFEVEYFVY